MGKKTGPTPTDRGKGGVKRRLLTEGNGMPLSVVTAGANRHDMKRLQPTLEAMAVERPAPTADAQGVDV